MDKQLIDKIGAILTMSTTSAATTETPIQTVQLEGLAGEVLDEVENIGTYGFTSSVPEGGQAIVGCIGGNRDFPFVLAIGHNEHRPTDLENGESAMYTKFDNEIRLNKNGEIVLNSGTDFAVAFDKLKTEFNELNSKYNKLITALNGWVPVANDGGAALKTALTGAAPLNSIAAIDNAKVEKVRI